VTYIRNWRTSAKDLLPRLISDTDAEAVRGLTIEQLAALANKDVKGNPFGLDLSPSDRRTLIAFLKTLSEAD
jgi:hypothetical protein